MPEAGCRIGRRRGLAAAAPLRRNGAKRINPTAFDCFAVAFLLLGGLYTKYYSPLCVLIAALLNCLEFLN